MKTELGKRIMLELIERRYSETQKNEIRIDENDFRETGHYSLNTGYNAGEIVEILLALEKVGRGKIKLISVVPKNDKPMNYVRGFMEETNYGAGGKTKYPDYLMVEYHPLATLSNKKGDKEILKLSRQNGLSRIINGKPITYGIKGKRYNLLSTLQKKFITTKEIADKIGEKDLGKVRSQIGQIRRKIEEKLSLNGEDVIKTSATGEGYKIGEKIQIINY